LVLLLLIITEQGEINFSQDNGGWASHALLGKLDLVIITGDQPMLLCYFYQWMYARKYHLIGFCCFQSSVNGKETKIPFPWLVFNEKVKVNSVFLRDSTAISDSILLLFGGNIKQGGLVSSFELLICC
jgi:hypothetical protein